jgi:hypothetical protein
MAPIKKKREREREFKLMLDLLLLYFVRNTEQKKLSPCVRPCTNEDSDSHQHPHNVSVQLQKATAYNIL